MDAEAVLGQLMLAFDGFELPEPMARRLRARPAAGVTLFRHANVADAAQVRSLTDAIQRLAPPGEPFLIAADQEGGQLSALGAASTPFAGAMALGATGDEDLAERVGAAVGRELRAVGVNVNYAPVCDLATNPANPGLGVRSFGDDPTAVARLVRATVRGLAAGGVAASLKHYPGIGDVTIDTHHGAVAVEADAATLRSRELVPFASGIAAGASLVMSGHAAVPALSGGSHDPATVSPALARDVLRGELGFDGVAISDALNMRALAQDDAGRAIEAIAALRAGLDLLLLVAGGDALDDALVLAAARGLVPGDATAASLARAAALRRRLAAAPDGGEPGLEVVGSEAHRRLAGELAHRSLTLVRDADGVLPLRLDPDDELFVVMPRPSDLTPADTSSTVEPALADAMRQVHPSVTGRVVQWDPSTEEIGTIRAAAAGAAALVVGTISASFAPGQVALVEALLSLGLPTVTVALRTPWDLDAYPAAGTHACTYSILDPSLAALAGALVGRAAFPGRLPVRLATAGATGS